MKILLTGYTGALGREIAQALAGHEVFALVRDLQRTSALAGVTAVGGSLGELPTSLAGQVEAIVHGAALTAFRAPREELYAANVQGTDWLLEFARRCPRLQRFLHLSTTCVAGDRGGLVPEAPLARTHFVNAYEETKWEAEGLVLASGLPVEIARIATVAGRAQDGRVQRVGALHHALMWLWRGLIPMMPGRAETPVDLVSAELVAAGVRRLLEEPATPGRIVHLSAGAAAPRLGELLELLPPLFAGTHRRWQAGAASLPALVSAETFALFGQTVRQSRDPLFLRVCADAEAFLPALLHPRTMATSLAETLPATDWRKLVTRVFTWLLAHDWARPPQEPALP